MELLLVLGISFSMLGIGVGVYLSVRRSVVIRGEAAKVAALISNARNSAVMNRSPAVVVFSAKPDGTASAATGEPISHDVRLHASVRETVAAWHFERVLSDGGDSYFQGSRDYHGRLLNNATAVPDGRVGGALYLPPSTATDPAPHVEIGDEPHYVPALDLRDGVYIEAWVKPHRDAALSLNDGNAGLIRMPIVGKWDPDGQFSSYTLYLEYSWDQDENPQKCFAVGASVHTNATLGNDPRRARSRYRIRPGEWTHVAMEFRYVLALNTNTRLLTTYINGRQALDPAIADERSDSEPIAKSSGPVRIGALDSSLPDARFIGHIDEVRICTYAGTERMNISGRVGLALSGFHQEPGNVNGRQMYRIEFGPSGRLVDTDVPPRVLLFSDDGGVKRKVHALEISLLGGVQPREWEERFFSQGGGWRPWPPVEQAEQ